MTIPDLLDTSNNNINNNINDANSTNNTNAGNVANSSRYQTANNGTTSNGNVTSIHENNQNNSIVPFGQILIDDSDRPTPSSYVPPAATPIIDSDDDVRIPQAKYEPYNVSSSSASPPSSGTHHYEQYQQQQYQQYQQQHQAGQQQQGQNQQYSPYVYATSYAGQPVLVSISPVGNDNNNIRPDDGLPAAHHENPVTKAIRRDRRRRHRAFVGGLGGMVAGGVVLGPFGLIIGYFTGSTIGLSSAVAGEKRKDRRLRREREAYARTAHGRQ